MKDGFIKVAAIAPKILLGDCKVNADSIARCIKLAQKNKVHLLAFPSLVITGSSCADAFEQQSLIEQAKFALFTILEATKKTAVTSLVGLPLKIDEKLFECIAVIHKGNILGIVPTQTDAPYFEKLEGNFKLQLGDQLTPIGSKLLFVCDTQLSYKFAVVHGADALGLNSPAPAHASSGASIICTIAKDGYLPCFESSKENIYKEQSRSLVCGYVYANAGLGESSGEQVFAADHIICEMGEVLEKSKIFFEDLIISEIDTNAISARRRKGDFYKGSSRKGYTEILFSIENTQTTLTRAYKKEPFLNEVADLNSVALNIILAQGIGLSRRMEQIGAKQLVLGLSGGLDSTLAAIAAVQALQIQELSPQNLLCYSLPCFGSSQKTKANAQKLAAALDVSYEVVDITNTVLSHFKDIQQEQSKQDITFENAQARTRTLFLFDKANQHNALVVGTGDLSELALGFCTFNGDHMSSYGVNAGLPKTLMQAVLKQYAKAQNSELCEVLLEIVNTPISPELLPTKDGEIAQKTEEIIGAYELHDFFLYYHIKYGFVKDKILRLAAYVFENKYTAKEIEKTLETFYKRFYSQQFKRNCSPDGAALTEISLAPHSFIMPSDINYTPK